ncbi:pre-mRNA cleavage and polyadenylation factor (CPF) complex subunit [Malassezia nana]|uniref:Polyadenylation factor subunit 2 n=1 Tax=Malassezia nana TaxID=180528 RepID=A0AAF0EU01_9BASI|nr:pre-mRNA cleavage and polyadenylation factor (CPF) complex subunit [Malassezia nana]
MSGDGWASGDPSALRSVTYWAPKKYLSPPAPPPLDIRAREEEAAMATALAAGFEGRRVRRTLYRRTVDYWGSVPTWMRHRAVCGPVRHDWFLRPTPHQVIDLLSPVAYTESVSSVGRVLVHTSTNKVRCPVNVVRWLPEGRRLVTGSTSGEFTLWNGLTFHFESILQAHDSAVRAMAWSHSGTWLVSADQNGHIKYFQHNMNNVQAFVGHRDAIRGISFAPDDQRFVTVADDSTLKIWGFDEAQEESTLKGHGWEVKCVDWHPQQALLVSGSKDNLVKFWDPRSGIELGTFHGHKNTVQAVQWNPAGHLVATASRDQSIKLYDIRAMQELCTLKGHAKEVCSLEWHPVHSDLLVSGGSEGSILYWSLRAPQVETPIYSLAEAHESNVWSLQWHPLGHLLASGSNDHTTRFWSRGRPGEQVEASQDSTSGPSDPWADFAETDDVIPGLAPVSRPTGSSGDAIPGLKAPAPGAPPRASRRTERWRQRPPAWA